MMISVVNILEERIRKLNMQGRCAKKDERSKEKSRRERRET